MVQVTMALVLALLAVLVPLAATTDAQTGVVASSPPTVQDLAEAISRRLASLARSASRPVPRLGLDQPLEPLVSASSLKYVHEGDLLRLRLVLDNVTLEGCNTMSVQEVSFNLHPDDLYDDIFAGVARGDITNHPDWYDHHNNSPKESDRATYDYGYDDMFGYERWEKLATGEPLDDYGRKGDGNGKNIGNRTKPRPPVTSEGQVRVAFQKVVVRARYQVRGSAGGFFTFREGGDLTLTAPTVFLTSRLNVTLPGFTDSSRRRVVPSRHSRVKVVWVHSDVSIASTQLTLQPATYPPEWVRQQVQSKLEELSSDLSHGHGAVRLLMRRWGKLLKRLIHRTARSLLK